MKNKIQILLKFQFANKNIKIHQLVITAHITNVFLTIFYRNWFFCVFNLSILWVWVKIFMTDCPSLSCETGEGITYMSTLSRHHMSKRKTERYHMSRYHVTRQISHLQTPHEQTSHGRHHIIIHLVSRYHMSRRHMNIHYMSRHHNEQTLHEQTCQEQIQYHIEPPIQYMSIIWADIVMSR